MTNPRKRITRTSQHEFVAAYCVDSSISFAEFNSHWIALPCDCGLACKGWAVVPRDAAAIALHRKLYT